MLIGALMLAIFHNENSYFFAVSLLHLMNYQVVSYDLTDLVQIQM